MTKWMVFFALLISGSILGLMYHQLGQFNAESGAESAPNPSAIRITDGYKDGIHRLNGTIRLPHSCFAIKTNAEVDKNDPKVVMVTIHTKDNMLDQPVCANIRTRYSFEVIVDAQQEVVFRLFVDEVEFPIAVTQVDWQSPAGNVYTNEQ